MVGCAGRTDLLKVHRSVIRFFLEINQHYHYRRDLDEVLRHTLNFLVVVKESLLALVREGVFNPGLFLLMLSKYTVGNIVDYLFGLKNEKNEISITALWKGMIYGLQDIWPASRTQIGGKNMGDVWTLSYLPDHEKSAKYVTFHKLSQWLTYSLMEPLQEAGLKIKDLHLMTGLPEYRNGGLLVDYGVLIPKKPTILTDSWDPSSEVIVEWRALTVALLDEIHKVVLTRLKLSSEVFPLVKV